MVYRYYLKLVNLIEFSTFFAEVLAYSQKVENHTYKYINTYFIINLLIMSVSEDLICPITGEWLDDPVSVPCCGRSFSRESLNLWMQSKDGHLDCPMCRCDITNDHPSFQIASAPKNINIASIVDTMKQQGTPLPVIKKVKLDIDWAANLYRLSNLDEEDTDVHCLEITSSLESNTSKCLVIPVIDHSGSMGNSTGATPLGQVNQAMKDIVSRTKSSQNLALTTIMYDTAYQILNMQYVENNPIPSGGGTSFACAFDGICKVLTDNANDINISSAVIIFLTDGQDGSRKEDRPQMIANLKKKMTSLWSKPITVHTIGFGSGHDFEFLNQIRVAGTIEGAYKFADPNENADSLSAKISSIFNAVAANVSTQIEVYPIIPKQQSEQNEHTGTKKPGFFEKLVSEIASIVKATPDSVLDTEYQVSSKINVLQKNKNNVGNLTKVTGDTYSRAKYYVTLSGPLDPDCDSLLIKINKEEFVVPINLITDKHRAQVMWVDWTSKLIDEIAVETIKLSENTSQIQNLQHRLHGALLQQRGRAALKHIVDDDQTARLTTLLETVSQILAGQQVNKQKLTDISFEGQFKTKFAGQTAPVSYTSTPALPSGYQPAVPQQVYDPNSYWLYKYRTLRKSKWGGSCTQLMLSASKGHYWRIDSLCQSDAVNEKNDYGETALDLAALYGNIKTYRKLKEHGAAHGLHGNELFYTCLMQANNYIDRHGDPNSYYLDGYMYLQMASELLENNVAKITSSLFTKVPKGGSFNWLMQKQAKTLSPLDKVNLAISKGMYTSLVDSINSGFTEKISFEQHKDIFAKSSFEHIRTIEYLLSNKLADPNEIMKITSTEENEITWPLFIACENGNTMMAKVLMKYMSTEDLNKQNLKGTTVLWISSCNRQLDLVLELIGRNVDLNLPNNKGDSPLIPSCQKGNFAIAEILLKAGTKIFVFNKNRDNPVLICCRTGQSEILNLIMSTLTREEKLQIMSEYAEIDEFNPLLASTELNRVECIKVLHQHGADLECMSANDNAIIKGATALHLACHYNRLASVKTLVHIGSNINAVNYDGYSALHLAVKGGHYDIVGYLISQGCDQSIVDNEGHKADFYADKRLMSEFFTEPLLEPLMELIKHKKEVDADQIIIDTCCQILLNNGCSYGCYQYINITRLDCGNGVCPLTLAIQHNNKRVVELFLKMGADVSRADNNGLSPAFWAHVVNSQFTLPPSNTDFAILDKVYKSVNENIQNKMLLSTEQLSTGQEIVPTASVIDKMNLGYGGKINPAVLENIEVAQFVEHSLLGFLDKFRNTSMYFDSKIHMLKTLATLDLQLKPIHILALYLWSYSPDVYNNVYQTLTDWQLNAQTKQSKGKSQSSMVWESYIYCLYGALVKLPCFTKEVYRAVDVRFDPKAYPIGSTVYWNTFSSTSSDWKHTTPLINSKRGIVFIIHSKNGRLISEYSKYPADNEVVFLPKSKFIVENYYKADQVCLGQANIRKSTFSVNDKYIENAVDCKNCIFVELKEVD